MSAQLSIPPSQRTACSSCGSTSTALVHHTHRMVHAYPVNIP